LSSATPKAANAHLIATPTKIQISMLGTKLVANKIYGYLIRHEDTVRHIGALALWNRPVFSAIFLVAIESAFFIIRSLPFRKSCTVCLGIGLGIFLSAVHEAIPGLFSIFKSFEIHPRKALAPDRERTVKEIAAYLTTVLSVWTSFVSLVFESIETASVGLVIGTIGAFIGVFAFAFAIGDFWFIWLWFHIVFVVPGIVALPAVQAWLTQEQRSDGEANEAADAGGDGRDGE
jgi:hypothetical protein